jgi:DNA-directed RNA polymerase specialized sigma24 family protein
MQTDADLVYLARAGDRHALAAIYDRYGDRIYDLCSSVLRDPEAAFDAMVDTFVLAALELYRLRRPDKLEPWLFALAREQLLARKIPIGADQHVEFDGPTGAAAAVGAGAIVWEAVSWFPPKDRILLELHARQPLDHRALAAALGVSIPHAAGLVRDLDERLERLMSALLVARLSRPGCPPLERLIAGEDQEHPDAWLSQVALHVDVCRTCLLWREDQPSALQLVKEVPSEQAPPEVREEVLDRIDLLWSQLGPPDWSASVATGKPVPVAASEEAGDTAPVRADAAAETTDDAETVPAPAAVEAETATSPATSPAMATGDEAVEPAAPSDAGGYVAGGYGQYDEYEEMNDVEEIESLLPPPPRLRRNGFPRRAMYPNRRRRVLIGVLVVAGLITAAAVTNFRGFGSQSDRLFAAEQKAAAGDTATPAPATTAPATTAPGPDVRPPFVFNLATVLGCIGPNQTTTTALVSVADDRGRPRSVELFFVDATGAETARPMTRRAGNEYEATIGPYTTDGNIEWRVVGTDEAGNTTTGSGPAVAALSSC